MEERGMVISELGVWVVMAKPFACKINKLRAGKYLWQPFFLIGYGKRCHKWVRGCLGGGILLGKVKSE